MRDTFDGQEAARSAFGGWGLQHGSSGLVAGSGSLGGAVGATRIGATQTGDEEIDTYDANVATVRWLALGHVAAGLIAALVGLVLWIAGTSTTPLLGAVAGVIVALTGLVAFLLAGSPQRNTQRRLRMALPVADVLTCVAALAWMGPTPLTLALFFIPACVATVALSWRSGAALTALDIALFVVINVLRDPKMDSWIPDALTLAGVSSLLAFAYGVFAAQMSRGLDILEQRTIRLRALRDQQNAEQQRLLEGLNLLEETQARLEQERAYVNAQLAELTTVAYRLAEGDVSVARVLRPGMSGSLDVLSGALLRLSQRLAAAFGGRHLAMGQKRQLDILAAALRDQTAMLVAAETTLRDLSASAHALVAEVQRVERGSGELPGLDRHALFQALRAVEQRTIEQAANTGVLSSRMAQLRGRQAELEAEARRASQAVTESVFGVSGPLPTGGAPAGTPVFDSSGLYAREAMGAPATPSWPHFPPGR